VASISREEAFAIWAPDGALWSEWAKPMAFVQAGDMMAADPVPDSALPGWPGPDERGSIVIVNLPGAAAVYAGLSLAERGFRPVPLFNGTDGPAAVVDVSVIARVLAGGAARLKRTVIAANAPPAFLIDSRRGGTADAVRPGAYDNRWVVLPQDFPSGALVASRGFTTAALIQDGTLAIPEDLAHVLRRWQESGIRIRAIDVASGQTAESLTVPKPPRFRLAWYAALTLLGLRRSNVGGFGSTIPQQTAGRGGFYG
jgi:hypothetical protein